MSGERRTVFGVLAVRDEVDIVRINVLHHLHTACDRIIVVDNGSSDGTTAVLKRLAAKLPVDWTVDNGEFTQSEIVSAMADDARVKGAEWVLPLDADEFWNGTRDVRELAGANPDAGAIRAHRIEFIQDRAQRRRSARALLTMTRRIEHPEEGVDAIDRFLARQLSMFETQPAPKLIFRAVPGLVIDDGAHAGSGLAGEVIDTTEFVVFHAPLRASVDLRRRALSADRHMRDPDDPYKSVQTRFWSERLAENDLDRLWPSVSYSADGTLDVWGRTVPTIEDARLADLLGLWVRSPREQLLARLMRRSY